jgi:hypothetical protein
MLINRYAEQKYDHISKFPPEILARIMCFFDVKSTSDPTKISSEGKQLVRFWIECIMDTRLHKKIKSAMKLIDIPYCLLSTSKSWFAECVSDISLSGKEFPTTVSTKTRQIFNDGSENICFDEFQKILATVQTKSRVKYLDIVDPDLDEMPDCEDTTQALLKLYGEFTGATHIVIGPSYADYGWGTYTFGLLDFLPNVKCIDADFNHIVVTENIFPNIREIWNIRCYKGDNIPIAFPNLVILTLCGGTHQGRHIDLSGLHFLQEFGWYKIQAEQIKHPCKILELTLFGEDLRKLHINKSVHVNVKCKSGTLDKLNFLSVDCYQLLPFSFNHDHIRTDAPAMELYRITPNLRHLAIDGSSESVLDKIPSFTQINHLELRSTKFRGEMPLTGGIDSCKNLTKLTLINVHAEGKLRIWKLLSSIEYLVWINVVEHVGSSNEATILPPFAVCAMRNLKYLKVKLTEIRDLDPVISALCEIETLHIINPMLPMIIYSDFDLDTTRYHKLAVHVEEFLSYFHMVRLDLVYDILTGYSALKTWSKKLIFESPDPVKTILGEHNEHIKNLYAKILSGDHKRGDIYPKDQTYQSKCKLDDVMFSLVHRQIGM